MRQNYGRGFHIDDREKFTFLPNEQGICLTELMVSLAVGAIMLATTLEAFNFVQAHATEQQRAVAQHQDRRLGLEVFEQEVRLAVAESIHALSPDEFLFLANVNNQRTTISGVVAPGQLVIPVLDGSGWGAGKTVVLCGPQTCETHRLSRAGQRYQLTLAEPVGIAVPAGASIEVRNRLHYYAKRDEQGVLRLMRMVDGGASVLIGNLESVRFSYRDEQGFNTSIPSQVKRVIIEILPGPTARRIVREVSLRS
jgi:hypothetical protein